MKKTTYLISIFALFAITTSTASTPISRGNTALGYFDSYDIVEENRELPRTQTISYSSSKEALEASHASSLYMQPIVGEWTKSNNEKQETLTNSFTMPFKWVDRQIFIHIAGVRGAYYLTVNGHYVGYNQSSATPAEFDLTQYVVDGANTVSITTPTSHDPISQEKISMPQLMGEVYLLAQPKVRIRDYVFSTSFEGRGATVELGVALKTHLLNKKEVRLYYSLLSSDGAEVATGHRDVTIAKRSEDTIRFLITLPTARAWSLESPELYTLLLKTQHEGRYTEYVSYRVGLRHVGMDRGMLLINSFPTPIAMAEYSARVDSTTCARTLTDLKNEGYNLIKLKGTPQPYFFYQICDRLGLYVCNQSDINTERYGVSRAKGGNPSNDPIWRAAYVDRVLTMYHTSHNHPSVVMFSIADESSNGYNLYESYMALRGVESAAPIIYLDADGEWNSDAIRGAQSGDWRIALSDQKIEPVGDITPSIKPSGDEGQYTISNPAQSTAWHGDVVYIVRQGSKVISEGRLEVSIEPQKSIDIEIPAQDAKSNRKSKYTIELVQAR